MKVRTLVIAALVLIALGAYVVVVEVIGGKKRQAAEEWESKLFKINDWDEVKTIEIWNYQQHMVFEKVSTSEDEEEWWMRKPFNWLTDKSNFNSLLSTLQFAEIDKRIDGKGKDLDQFGLAKPPRIIVVKTGTRTLEVLVGELAPVGNSVYVKYPDSDYIFMVSGVLDRQLKHPPFYFRDKRVFRIETDAIRAIEFEKNGKLAYRIEKGKKGWKVVKPKELPADEDAVDRLLSKISALRIGSIPAEEFSSLEAYGLDRPAKVLRITTESGEQKTLRVSSRSGKNKRRVFAKRDEWTQLLEIDKDALSSFDLTPDRLRDRRVARLDMDEVKEVALVFPDREVKVWRSEDSHWHAEPVPEGKKVNEFWASNLGYHALKMKVDEFLSETPTDAELEKWGLKQPEVRVEIRAKDGKIIWFSLGKEAGENRRYGQLSSGVAVIFDDPDMSDFLEPDKTLWEEEKPSEEKDGKDND